MVKKCNRFCLLFFVSITAIFFNHQLSAAQDQKPIITGIRGYFQPKHVLNVNVEMDREWRGFYSESMLFKPNRLILMLNKSQVQVVQSIQRISGDGCEVAIFATNEADSSRVEINFRIPPFPNIV